MEFVPINVECFYIKELCDKKGLFHTGIKFHAKLFCTCVMTEQTVH